jgi:hypothetical protein
VNLHIENATEDEGPAVAFLYSPADGSSVQQLGLPQSVTKEKNKLVTYFFPHISGYFAMWLQVTGWHI